MEHHLETSPIGTFRVVEEEVEAEEEMDIPEVLPNPRIGVEEGATRKNIVNGMPHNHLALVEGDQSKPRLRGHGGTLTIVETAIVLPKRDLRIETPRKMIFPPTILKILMIERGLEVPAPEIIDTEGTEAMKDMTPGEVIMMRAETPVQIMVPAPVGGNIVQPEEIRNMTDMIGETRAPGIDLI